MEIWKDIPGWEGYYQASTLGDIRGVDRHTLGQGKDRTIKGKILKQHISDGYWALSLCKEGRPQVVKTHTLLCKTFIPNPYNLKEVNHKNGIRNDKRLENLERCTHSENIKHAYKYLGMKKGMLGIRGIKNKISKRIYQYTLEGEFIKKWDYGVDIQKELGYHKGNIAMVCRGERKQANGFIRKYTKNQPF